MFPLLGHGPPGQLNILQPNYDPVFEYRTREVCALAWRRIPSRPDRAFRPDPSEGPTAQRGAASAGGGRGRWTRWFARLMGNNRAPKPARSADDCHRLRRLAASRPTTPGEKRASVVVEDSSRTTGQENGLTFESWRTP